MVTLPVSTEVNDVLGPPLGRWSLADWENLPDDGNRYEIIDGVLYMSTAPSSFHQWISQQLYDMIGYPAKKQGLAIPFFAPIGVIMPGCDPVQPDFVVILSANISIIQNKHIYGIPDLLVEVLSPGSIAYDEKVKLFAYAAAGVPEYAIIDPAKRALRLYTLDIPGRYQGPREFGAGQSMSFACLPSISLEIRKLFEGAPDTTL
jgi:Uma2 family endonuclease